MTPTWLPTARALAEVWDGPPLAQFVVSEGPGVLEVDEYDHRGLPCEAVTTYPDLDTVPDLDSNAVGGEVLGALPAGVTMERNHRGSLQWTVCFDRASGLRASHDCATLAEAAALAYVAVR